MGMHNEGRGDAAGGLGSMGGGSQGNAYSGLDSADIGAALGNNLASRSGVNINGTGAIGAFDSFGNPTQRANDRGGTYSTAYGVSEYAKAHNMGLARAAQAVSDIDTNRNFAARRARDKAAYAADIPNVISAIKSKYSSPQVQMGLIDSMQAGKLGELQAAGVMTDEQARNATNAYGGFLDQVARGLGFARETPSDVTMPDENYIDAFSRGLIDKDRNPTVKGLVSTYAPFATTMLAPVVGAAISGITSNPIAQGLLGLGFQKAGQYAASKNPGSSLGNYANMANTALNVAGLPGIHGANLAATQAGALGYMGNATAINSTPDYGTTASGQDQLGFAGPGIQGYSAPTTTASSPDLSGSYRDFMGSYYG